MVNQILSARAVTAGLQPPKRNAEIAEIAENLLLCVLRVLCG
jgi:hypothetical protein